MIISVDELSEILNSELNKEFIDAMVELYDDGDMPVDPEHPDIEPVLEKIVDLINDLMSTLPMGDNYV